MRLTLPQVKRVQDAIRVGQSPATIGIDDSSLLELRCNAGSTCSVTRLSLRLLGWGAPHATPCRTRPPVQPSKGASLATRRAGREAYDMRPDARIHETRHVRLTNSTLVRLKRRG